MGKATFKGKAEDLYVNPALVVRIEPATDGAGTLLVPERCIVVLIDGLELEMDGTLDSVIQALKVP